LGKTWVPIRLVILGVISGVVILGFFCFIIFFSAPHLIPPSATLTQLRDYLVNGSSSEQAQAAVRLNELGLTAQDAVPDIIHVLRSDSGLDRDLRAFLIETLGVVGLYRKDVMEFLSQVPDDRYEFFKVPESMVRIHTPADQAVPVLIKSLSSPISRNRKEAAKALGQYKSEASQASLPLARVVCQDDTLYVRIVALAALRQIGTNAKVTVPTLAQLLDNKEDILKVAVAQTLEAIVGESFSNLEDDIGRNQCNQDVIIVAGAKSWYEKNQSLFQENHKGNPLYEVKPILDKDMISNYTTRVLSKKPLSSDSLKSRQDK